MIRYTFAGVLLLLAGAIFFFYTKPTYDSVGGLKEQGAQYDAALGKAAELQARKQVLLQNFNSFAPVDLDRLRKLLPDHVDNIALILDFDNLASRFQMPIENVDVSMPASAGASKGSIGAGTSGQKYDSVTIKFSTHGTYENFLAFLKGLESSLRIVDMVSLSITPGNSSSTDGQPLYSFGVTLRTYWLK